MFCALFVIYLLTAKTKSERPLSVFIPYFWRRVEKSDYYEMLIDFGILKAPLLARLPKLSNNEPV